MYNKNSHVKNTYLLSLDNLNKHSLKSIHHLPHFTSITISFSLDNLIQSSFLTSLKLDKKLKILAYFYMYILTTRIPYINSNNIKINTKSVDALLKYSLSISYTDSQTINDFLKYFFIESGYLLKIDNLKFKNDNDYSFQVSVPILFFPDICDFLLTLIPGINTKEFLVNLNFTINPSINYKNSNKNIIRCLNFFG
jgi:K+ transporter